MFVGDNYIIRFLMIHLFVGFVLMKEKLENFIYYFDIGGYGSYVYWVVINGVCFNFSFFIHCV